MAELNCVLWNCSGISGSSAGEKVDFLFTFVASFDILVLVETHHRDVNDIHSSFHTYRNAYHFLHTGAVDGDPCAGIVVLINKNLTVSDDLVLMPGRIINFKVGNHGREYNISAVYGFTGGSATRVKMREMVDCLSQVHRPASRNMVLGDFNFVDNDLDRVNDSRVGKNPKDTSLAVPWVEFIDGMDLSDPFRVKKNQKEDVFICAHPEGRKK